jgi:hypothetical protein
MADGCNSDERRQSFEIHGDDQLSSAAVASLARLLLSIIHKDARTDEAANDAPA